MEAKELIAEAVITAEFEAFLSRCEAAGVSRQEARGTISGVLAMESLKRWCDDARAQEEKAARTPQGVLLQKAFELWKENEKLERLGVTPDRSEYRAVCLAYLKTAHDVVPGDNVKVSGWAKPRSIEVVGLELTFHTEDKASDAFMFFIGPCWRNKPAKMMGDRHGCAIDSIVRKEWTAVRHGKEL